MGLAISQRKIRASERGRPGRAFQPPQIPVLPHRKPPTKGDLYGRIAFPVSAKLLIGADRRHLRQTEELNHDIRPIHAVKSDHYRRRFRPHRLRERRNRRTCHHDNLRSHQMRGEKGLRARHGGS